MSSHHRKYFLRLISILLFAMMGAQLQAQVIAIDANHPLRTVLQNDISWYVDTTGAVQWDKIKQQPFSPYEESFFATPKKDWNYWANIRVSNQSGNDQEYILQTNKWGYFDAYIVSE